MKRATEQVLHLAQPQLMLNQTAATCELGSGSPPSTPPPDPTSAPSNSLLM